MGAPILRLTARLVLIFALALDRIKMPNKPVEKRGGDLMVCRVSGRTLYGISLKIMINRIGLSLLKGVKAVCLKES